MAGTSEFTAEERNLLVRLPRWIAGAASAAHVDNASKTSREMENGFLSVANGRRSPNVLLADLGRSAMDLFDQDPAKSGVDPNTAEGAAAILEHAKTAMNILRAKAEPGDVSAYRRWLLEITDDVIGSVRAHERLGFGGVPIHPEEQAFRDRLAAVLR